MITARHTTGQLHRLPRADRSFALRCLDWLVRADASYRDGVALKFMPQERLDDMGITPAEANSEFLTRPGFNRWTPLDPSGW